jgi:RHS repeat-associated protein
VSSTGTITGARQMDVYGALRASQGAPTSKHAYVGALGHPTEDDTGLIYMRARWMDPVTGTFVSEDPARDGANWFGYALAGPTKYVDSTGLFAVFISEEDALEVNAQESAQAIRSGNWITNKINRIFDAVQQGTGMSRQNFREYIHAIKHEMGMGAREDLWFNQKTGHLVRKTGEGLEDLGHWLDWLL